MNLTRALACAGVVQAFVLNSNLHEKDSQTDVELVSRGPPPVCVTVLDPKPPPTAYCGATGKLTTRSILFKTIISGPQPLQQCRDQCLADNACVSFAWKAADAKCRGFASSLKAQGFKAGPSNGNLFYSRGCFKVKCTSASCVSARLTDPIPITDYSGGTSNADYQGFQTFQVPLPFPIGYGVYAKSAALVGLNGYLHSGETATPYLSWAPFYDPGELQILQGRDQGIFYEITGQAPNRIVKFEWRTTSLAQPAEIYDFVLQLNEAEPTIATYSYLQITDDGSEGYSYIKDSVGNTVFYSSGEPTKLHSGLILDLQTNTQAFTVNTLPICD